MATLKDIARETGFSLPTVQQVLNGRADRFAIETQQKVIEAAKRLKYKPNLTARGLAQRKSFLVGTLQSSATLPLIGSVNDGVQEAVTSRHYTPVHFVCRSLEEEERFCEHCQDRHVDGLIVNLLVESDGASNAEHFAQLREGGLPIVEINGRVIPNVPHVWVDYHEAGRRLTRRMIDDGHTRVVLYVPDTFREAARVPGWNWTSHEFWRGYQSAVKEAGLEPIIVPAPQVQLERHEDLSLPGELPMTVSRRLLELPMEPTAVICQSDFHAQALAHFMATDPGAMRFKLGYVGTLRRAWFVPRDAVILLVPALQVGLAAAEALLAAIDGKPVQDVCLQAVEAD